MNELLHVGWCGTNPWRCQSAQLQLVEAVHKSFYSGTIVAIDAGGETIEATVGHPFWVVSGESLALRPAAHELGTPISRGGRWVESDDLRIGDKLLARDGSQIAVTAIRTRTTQEWVYNLTVRRTHTYTVGSAGVVVHNTAKCTDEKVKDFDGAREEAFEKAGMTDPDSVVFSKVDEATGTVVEFKGPGGAKVGYDGPHKSPGPHHDTQHISWQSAGKRGSGGAERGNIPYSGNQHPSRSDRK